MPVKTARLPSVAQRTRWATFALFGAAALLTAASAFAQYAGPGAPTVIRSVAEVLKNAPEDAPVELEGHLVKMLSKDKYLFSDGKDQIRVEIDRDDFPTLQVSDKTKVRLRGEVEKDFMQSPEVDVSHVQVIE